MRLKFPLAETSNAIGKHGELSSATTPEKLMREGDYKETNSSAPLILIHLAQYPHVTKTSNAFHSSPRRPRIAVKVTLLLLPTRQSKKIRKQNQVF